MSDRVLIIEDREEFSAAYQRMLAGEGWSSRVFATARPALEHLRLEAGMYDCIISDYQLPDLDGLTLLRILQKEFAAIPVILITGHGSVQTAIEAMKHGAYDYLEKPVERETFLKVLGQAIAQKRRSVDAVSIEAAAEAAPLIVGRSRAMIGVYKEIGRVAQFTAPVLIQGETGTGKDLVASAIHRNSPRQGQPFKAINCSAIPENLLESELFGHEKGAFTGAHATRKGLFEATDQGTLFLDEIGDMPLALQAKLLRVLQSGVIQRVGGTQDIQVNVRVLAATHRNLHEMIARQAFREDLYHRLAAAEVRLPPLRERPEDIPLLTHYFLQHYARELGMEKATIAQEAIDYIAQQPWPGNVRELQNTLRKALMRARNLCITRENVAAASENPASVAPVALVPEPVHPVAPLNPAEALARWVDAQLSGADLERETALRERLLLQLDEVLFPRLLERLGDNRTRAAQILGITRNTFRKRLGELPPKD
ncbi:MAG: sigma-54 dependent transcriptional regulator [Verrucomicrobiota bacterium JB022]|nr:sigma-54 dependent transcriptional regulator [Verrucomicrobiota bacterium JB022]